MPRQTDTSEKTREADVYEWTERLAVGVETIDSQHRELFAAINRLLREDGGASTGEIPGVIAFLEDYVINHFGMEEVYMRRLSYPGFPFHKGEHVSFVSDFYDLRDEFDANGATPEIADRMGRFIGDWLVNHIGRVDKALGAFLREKGRK
ncbi:MAG: hemerythrin [Deltaproteobacteria bacterium]|nr:MAG: hemerythrin [Deltaproteobacteria bacterium]